MTKILRFYWPDTQRILTQFTSVTNHTVLRYVDHAVPHPVTDD